MFEANQDRHFTQNQGWKKKPEDEVFGQGSWDIRDSDVTLALGCPRSKTLCKAPFSVVLDGMAGMSRDLGRDVPASEKLSSRKLWAEFSFPASGLKKTGLPGIQIPTSEKVYCRDQNYSGSGKMLPGVNFSKFTDFIAG